jgi:hypothetical protein
MKMKIKLNKLLGLIIAGVFLISFNSCLKNSLAKETDFSTIQDHVVIIKGGVTNFGAANVAFNGADTATVTLIIDLASVNLPKSPVVVTLGVDESQIAPYNASAGTNFQPFPVGTYSITTTSLTIPAGQQYAQTTVSFYKDSLDPAVSYLLPISITDASGKALTSNLNTIFYNVIGNPLAGVYTMTGTRYNFNNGPVQWAGPPDPIPSPNSGTTAYAADIVVSPVDAHTVTMIMGNVPEPAPGSGLAHYFVTADNTFATITYDFTANFNAGYSKIQKYVVAYTPPSPTQKASFHLMSKYNNAPGDAGNDRLIDQTFTQQ